MIIPVVLFIVLCGISLGLQILPFIVLAFIFCIGIVLIFYLFTYPKATIKTLIVLFVIIGGWWLFSENKKMEIYVADQGAWYYVPSGRDGSIPEGTIVIKWKDNYYFVERDYNPFMLNRSGYTGKNRLEELLFNHFFHGRIEGISLKETMSYSRLRKKYNLKWQWL